MVNRIRELLEIRQLSPTQFADLVGVGRPVISHILSERNKPSLEVVQKVISAFPDVSLAWLMSGTGPMLSGAPPTDVMPATPPDSAIPATSTVASAPVAAFVAAPSAPASPAPVVSAPTVATVPVAAPLPIVAPFPAVVQPSRLPQPPKFRPAASAKATSYPEPAAPAAAVAAITSPSSPAAAPLVATPPGAPAIELAPLPSPRPSPSPSPPDTTPPVPPISLPPLVMAVPPVASASPSSVEAFATTTAPRPLAESADSLPQPAPNPAAAFSFLGEAGKTIRRIVLFYSDGSFSDYRPES